MGTFETVLKQTQSFTNEQGVLLFEEAKNAHKNNNIDLARTKLIQAVEAFRLSLSNKPHDKPLRTGLTTTLDYFKYLYPSPSVLNISEEDITDLNNQSFNFKAIKNFIYDALIEVNWKKQCTGKFGGPKPIHMSWKEFYLYCEKKLDSQDTVEGKIFWLIKAGHYELLKTYLNRHKDIDINLIQTKEEISYIECAVRNNFSEIVMLLIEKDANINLKGSRGWTPLFWAIVNNSQDISKLLINKKAKVNVKDKTGLTPLHIAAYYGYTNLVELLLENKAKVNIKENQFNAVPLHFAVQNNHVRISELLLEKNTRITTLDTYHRSFLHWAISENNSEIVKLLLSYGAKPDVADDINRTPTHWYAQFGQIKALSHLIDAHADISIKDKFGDTPMIAAAYSGQSKEMLLLFEKLGR